MKFEITQQGEIIEVEVYFNEIRDGGDAIVRCSPKSGKWIVPNFKFSKIVSHACARKSLLVDGGQGIALMAKSCQLIAKKTLSEIYDLQSEETLLLVDDRPWMRQYAEAKL